MSLRSTAKRPKAMPRGKPGRPKNPETQVLDRIDSFVRQAPVRDGRQNARLLRECLAILPETERAAHRWETIDDILPHTTKLLLMVDPSKEPEKLKTIHEMVMRCNETNTGRDGFLSVVRNAIKQLADDDQFWADARGYWPDGGGHSGEESGDDETAATPFKRAKSTPTQSLETDGGGAGGEAAEEDDDEDDGEEVEGDGA